MSTVIDIDDAALSRRERRKQEVRGRITEAAISLFAERGCELTTVEDICELAEVARKTFYNYFSSKQQLIRELSESLLYDETLNLVDLAIEKRATTRERIRFFCAQVSRNLERYENLERSLIHQTLLDLSSEDSRAGQQLGLLNEAFTRLIAEGRELGDVNPNHTVAFLGEMAVGAMNAVIINWMHRPGYPLAERIGELTEFLCEMLSVR
jgi:AcrR family transcriptional regulator